jgi:poly(ADP-ribose) glycohydrolase ARH3
MEFSVVDPTCDQFVGSMVGLAVGDAVGAPYEGLPSDLIFECFGSREALLSPPDVEVLRYTDDTQMAIGVAEVLCQCGEIREELLTSAFAENYEPHRGYGQGARQLIEAMAYGGDWRALAQNLFPGGSFGNGAAMRVAPVGLVFCHDLDRVAEQARLSALPTHLHPLGIEGAVLLAVAVAQAATVEFAPASFYDTLQRYAHEEEFLWQLSVASQLVRGDSVRTLGNSLEAHRSVVTAIACFTTEPDSYPRAVSRAIALGNDTDTIAAMAGAISGARLGSGAIPHEMLQKLENGPKGRDYLESLAVRLFRRWKSQ